MKKINILVIGGGFGGVKAASELCNHSKFDVRLISDNRNFEHHPTLYRTATGGRRAISSIPLVEIFKGKPIDLVFDTVTTIDPDKKIVKSSKNNEYRYDIAIFALGVETNYFGIAGLKEFSYGVKSLRDAETLKMHLHEQLIDKKRLDLNYVVVGGGPTGIELAGALPYYLNQTMKKHGIKKRSVHVDLVEGAPRLLPRMPHSVSRAVTKRLKKLDIRLFLGKPVQAETKDALVVGGKPIRSHTVIWTAGTANNEFFKNNKFPLSPNGRVVVDKHMQALPSIFVIGDNADTKYSGMAQTALYDAIFVSNNIKRVNLYKVEPKNYKPKAPISVIPAGPYWAVFVWGKLQFYGWLGWLLRRAGDWISYKDISNWWKATELSLLSDENEDQCSVCAQYDQATADV